VDDFPSSILQAPADEAAVATPGEPFGTENRRTTAGGHAFQKFDSRQVGKSLGIGLIALFAVPAQLLSQIVVPETRLGQRRIERGSLEVGESAGWETAHIDHHLDSVRPEEMDELLPASVAGAQGQNGSSHGDDFVQGKKPRCSLLVAG